MLGQTSSYRQKGRKKLEATLVSVLANYAFRLQEVNGKLYLTGGSGQVYKEVHHPDKLRINGSMKAFQQEPALGLSKNRVVEDTEAWLLECEKKTPEE